MTTTTFTTLLDWVEGRLDARRAAEVETHVGTDAEAAETVAWIRSFREAGTVLPLQAPPEDLRRELRDVFRRHTATPPGVGPVSELQGSARPLRMAVGARAAEGEGVGHVVLEGEGLSLTLTVLNRRADLVDVHGQLSAPEGPRPEIVLTSPAVVERRVARPGPGGDFRLHDVVRSVDEVWVVGPQASLHARLDLRSDS